MTAKYSLLSYPDRGPYGDYTYRGNTSGYVIKDLIELYKPAHVMDPMAGSGTTRDVCAELNIPYVGFDLKDGFDLASKASRFHMAKAVDELTGRAGMDMIFWHPPYWNMIQYSDAPADFSNGLYPTYLNRMQDALVWLASQLRPGGFIALLLADLRRGQRTWFLSDDTTESSKVVKAGLLKEFRFIKVQHHTMSGGTTDYGVKMVHEYVTIMRKPLPIGHGGIV